MRHLTGSTYAQFDQPVHMYRGETMAGIAADESRHDSSRGFTAGYYLETLSLGPAFLARFPDPNARGRDFTSFLENYANTAGLWIVGEDMPQESNRVTFSTSATNQHRLTAPNVCYDDHANDVAVREYAYRHTAELYNAVGAKRTYATTPYPSAHNMDTVRMSERPEDGVVDKWGRAHDVPNLLISDGSVFTSSAAANPTLTLVALAIRQADHIAERTAAREL